MFWIKSLNGTLIAPQNKAFSPRFLGCASAAQHHRPVFFCQCRCCCLVILSQSKRLKDFSVLFNFHTGFISAILAIFPRGLRGLCPVSTSPQKGLTGIHKFQVGMEGKIRKCLLILFRFILVKKWCVLHKNTRFKGNQS